MYIVITVLILLYLPVHSAAQGMDILQPSAPQTLEQLSVRHNAEYMERRAGALEWAAANEVPVRRLLDDGKVVELQYIDKNGLPVYHTTFNAVSAVSIGTDLLYPEAGRGLDVTGQGYFAGVWDAGIADTSHREFPGRIIPRDSFTDPDHHATHVTGTIAAAGLNTGVRGMAWEAEIWSYDWNNQLTELTRAASEGLLVSNHSYGIKLGWTREDSEWVWNGPPDADEDYRFGFYTRSQSRALDELAYKAPGLLMVWSAGNSRGGTGDGTREPNGPFDCIGPEAISKNVLAVGAVDKIPGGYAKPTDVRMTSFSSWGPSDDGRVKPDIVAPGQALYSTLPEDRYGFSSGTSMSAPVVSGSLLLLQQLYHRMNGRHMKAATLKGLVIHTAYETGKNRGPDYSFGWGMLNTQAAADLVAKEDGVSTFIRELTLNDGDVYKFDFHSDGEADIVATISWTDLPGAPPFTDKINPPDIMLVHDLDIRITDETGNVYKPWVLDPADPEKPAERGDNYRDNVEKLLIGDPEPRRYTVTVSHKGELRGGRQNFSLIFSASLGQPVDQTNLYWTGGDGNWDDPENWSLLSGGEPAGLVPNDTINVVFDENSFKSTDHVIRLESDVACRSFYWLTRGGYRIDMSGHDVEINGDLLISGNLGLAGNGGDFIFRGDSGVINTGRNIGQPLRMVFDNPAGNWKLLSDLRAESLLLKSGNLDFSFREIYVANLSAAGELPGTMDISGSRLYLTESFVVEGGIFEIYPEDISIIINLEQDDSQVRVSVPGVVLDNIEVLKGILTVEGDNQTGRLVNRAETRLTGSNSVADMVIYPGSATYLGGGSSQVLDGFEVISTPEEPVLIHSLSEEPAGIIYDEYVKFCFDHLDISNVTAGGLAVFGSGINSSLSGETSGWIPGPCEDILFARFDVEFPCVHAQTRFADRSDGNPRGWFWHFGDEAASDDTSIFINPVYTYGSPGTYGVTMTISGNGDVTTTEREITIIENTLPKNEIVIDNQMKRFLSSETAPHYQWYNDDLPIPGATRRSLDMAEYTGEIRVLLTDDKCNRFSETLVVKVEEILPGEEQLVIYPNPVSDYLTVQFKSHYTGEIMVEVIDLTGRITANYGISKEEGELIFTMGSEWPSGLYMIRLVAGEDVFVERVVKR